jgi:hypothetical protein
VNLPELGPSLGRLVVPRRRHEPWVPIDDVREELATAVLELAGAGRAAAARADWRGMLQVTGRAVWLHAWERAVHRAAQRVAERVDAEIDVAARRVRMSRRRRRRERLSAGERRAIAARLSAAGGPFITVADELAMVAERVRETGANDVRATTAWIDALLGSARRLEAAWLALEDEVEAERVRWTPEIDLIARWRPPLWPVFALWLPLSALLIWLGATIGGYVPAPVWLARLLGF